jgi:hypothetical protein
MTGSRDRESDRHLREAELDWIAEHLTELRRGVVERRFRYQTLWSGLGIGLVVHVVGYLLKSSASGEPIGLLADVLYALGYALWTGVVVVALVEVIPAAKERQISRALDDYEAALRARGRLAPDESAAPDTRSQ